MELHEIVFFLISIGLAVLGTYLTLKTIKTKKPVFTKTNFNLITNNVGSFPELKMTFKGNKIENLSSTDITFWNSGNERIEKNDVAEKSPLRIEAKEGIKIFMVSIVYKTSQENVFEIKLDSDQNIIYCSFDYLSKKDGVVIQIIHSGLSSVALDFKGTIKDIGFPVDVTQKIEKSFSNYNSLPPLFAMSIAIFFLILLSIYLPNMGFFGIGAFFVFLVIGSVITKYLFNKGFLSSFFLFSSIPQYHHKFIFQ